MSFHGESVEEIRHAFQEAVDFYLTTCAERGEVPNKLYSGNLMLRVSPEVHTAVAAAAEVSGKSINQWAAEMLAKASQV